MPLVTRVAGVLMVLTSTATTAAAASITIVDSGSDFPGQVPAVQLDGFDRLPTVQYFTEGVVISGFVYHLLIKEGGRAVELLERPNSDVISDWVTLQAEAPNTAGQGFTLMFVSAGCTEEFCDLDLLRSFPTSSTIEQPSQDVSGLLESIGLETSLTIVVQSAPAPIPEPKTTCLVIMGLLIWIGWGIRKRFEQILSPRINSQPHVRQRQPVLATTAVGPLQFPSADRVWAAALDLKRALVWAMEQTPSAKTGGRPIQAMRTYASPSGNVR